MLLVLALILFVSLVVLHELGHFWAARHSGVEVEEFGLGFPPRAKKLFKKGGTLYTLNWLPLGGFVKLKGENDSAKEKGSYGAAPLWAKVRIMLAGVAMNVIVAFGMLTFLALVGMPKIVDNQFSVSRDTKILRNDVLVGYVEPGSPAETAGLKPGDRMESIGLPGQGQHTIQAAENLPALTHEFAGKKVQIEYRHNGLLQTVSVQLMSRDQADSSQKGYLGISPTTFELTRSTWSAPIVAAGLIKQFTVLTYKGLGGAISNVFSRHFAAASSEVSGPVGVFMLLKNGSVLGYQFILMIIAIISLTLALINVLPIPALDGGRLFVTLLYRAMRRPLSKQTEERIHGTGFLVLMTLVVLITIVDITRH